MEWLEEYKSAFKEYYLTSLAVNSCAVSSVSHMAMMMMMMMKMKNNKKRAEIQLKFYNECKCV